MTTQQGANAPSEPDTPQAGTPIKALFLRECIVRRLTDDGVTTVEQLIRLTERDLLHLHDIGPRYAKEIVLKLGYQGLHLASPSTIEHTTP